MNRKHKQAIYQLNVNVNLMGKNAVQIKGGITVNVDLSVQDKMYEKKNYAWNHATCNCQNGK